MSTDLSIPETAEPLGTGASRSTAMPRGTAPLDTSPTAEPGEGQRLTRDPAPIVAEAKRIFGGLQRDLVGFGPLLIQGIMALLCRENLLIFSPAGTAKTLFASLVFSRIRGAQLFDTQMSKGTLAEELFGGVDTEQLKKGRFVHNTKGTLADAQLAFVDEFFDANDMVLRALLGIFHERVFKRGCQVEKARLHTGIAAANYLRASEITEAVLDRFLFRAYVAPNYDAFNLLAIDQTFARNFGRHTTPPADDQIPLADLIYLSDIVRGLVPERAIRAAPHVLFLKNLIINRYRELTDAAAEKGRRAIYISPRTYAKARIVLNAAALLRGRTAITTEELPQLKYAITTVGGPDEQRQCFDRAVSDILVRIRVSDLEHIDSLVAAQELAAEIQQRSLAGEPVRCTGFLQRLMRLFGLVGDGELTFGHVRRYVEGVQPRDDAVRQFKEAVARQIQEMARRVDDQPTDLFAV